MPSISIITPSYNQASYLEQAIRSVLAQDSSDLEYIVVDGGSTDGSLEIINRYADHLSWWISEPDEGQGDAINKGLSRAKGDYVAWLNSDDLYLPGAVTAALDVLEANPNLGMVFADAITIDPSGKPLNRLTFGDWGLVELMSFRIICQPAVFMRRSVIEEAGYIDPSYHFMLDHQLWIRIARMSQIQHIKQTWAAARHHPSAKNVAQASAFSKEILRILEWMSKQSDLASIFKSYNKQINAGAQRLNARYLLDGGQPKEALQAYWKALTLDPGYTIHHWHRMLYALLSILGAGDIANSYYRIASSGHNWQPLLEENPQLSNWPGINLISK